MATFMDLPAEVRVMVYKYLVTEAFQPTYCKRPHSIPICRVSEKIRKEAYAEYLSSNNILFVNSRSACLWLTHISSFLSTQEEQPLHLTFDLQYDNGRPVGQNSTRKADQRRFFRLLSPRTKLDLTVLDDSRHLEEQRSCGALNPMHGFASVSSTPAPAADSRCGYHRCVHESYQLEYCRNIAADVVSEVGRRATALRDLRDHFTSACPAGCEHLADNGIWNSESTIHIDVLSTIGGDPNCYICFALFVTA